jgi:hypothetical protein
LLPGRRHPLNEQFLLNLEWSSVRGDLVEILEILPVNSSPGHTFIGFGDLHIAHFRFDLFSFAVDLEISCSGFYLGICEFLRIDSFIPETDLHLRLF